MAVSGGDLDQEFGAARKLLGMGAEGFILSGLTHVAALPDLLATRGVPFVYTSVWDQDSAVPTIGYDNAKLARNALQYLAEHGHETIAVIHGPAAESDRICARLDGARSALKDGLSAWFIETSLDVAGGKAAAHQALASPKNVTAILCFSDVLALGTYFALQEVGLSVPQDMSLMGFDNLDWTSEMTPPLTTMNLPARQMGQAAALQLMDKLDHSADLSPTEFAGHVIERGSVLRRQPID